MIDILKIRNWHILGVLMLAIGWAVAASQTTYAAQSAPYLLNFQGQLVDSSGVPVPDGLYNIRFRSYVNAPTGGTPGWTETHDGANRVQVTNGVFSTQLGAITPYASSAFVTSDPIYIEIELPTLATATCDGAGCNPSWTEGPMSPRQPIASSGYAMNADLIDGIDASSIAQLSANQTFSGNNTFTGTFLQQNTSSTAFQIQNAGGSKALVVDTSGLAVKIGGGDASPDASPALLVFDYKNTTGDPTGTDGAYYYNSAAGKMRCYEGIWRDCIATSRTRVDEREDFVNAFTYANAAQIHKSFVIGSSANPTRLVGEQNHPGIIRFTTGGSSTGIGEVAMNYDAVNMIQFGGATWTTTAAVRIPVISTSSQRFTIISGLYDNANTLAPANGCYFRHVDNGNSDRWQGVCRNANTESNCNPTSDGTVGGTSASTVTSLGTSQWYELRTRVNASATSATFTLKYGSNTFFCTVSNNIPPTNKVVAGTGIAKSVGLTARNLDVDFIEVIGDGLVR